MTPAAILAASQMLQILIPMGFTAVQAIERIVVALHKSETPLTPEEKATKIQFLLNDSLINGTLAHLDAQG